MRFYFSFSFFFRPIYYLRTILSPSLPVLTQIRGHIAGRPSPSPLRYVPSFFLARRIQHFLPSSTRVELYYCLLTVASDLWLPSCLPVLLWALTRERYVRISLTSPPMPCLLPFDPDPLPFISCLLLYTDTAVGICPSTVHTRRRPGRTS